MKPYIHQKPDWPEMIFHNEGLMPLLGEVRKQEGRLLGKMEALGFDLQSEANFANLNLDVLKSTEIEGELLNPEEVRSSIARRLGMDLENQIHSSRNVDGVVDMMLDATQNFEKELSFDRLFGWHSALFPSGRSGQFTIQVGEWRDDTKGPMQVVSGALGKEKVHFEAPNSNLVPNEMEQFVDWFNSPANIDPVIKAGIAHFWFLTIHPFDDGNGRIARALADMLLARADGMSQRFYSMSAQIRLERKKYYEVLEKSQQGSLDITYWLEWFLMCLKKSIEASEVVLSKVLQKHRFWSKHSKTLLNERQILILNKVLDGFHGKLSTSKYAKITKCSNDTALRDLQNLLEKGILQKNAAGGRSTSYDLIPV